MAAIFNNKYASIEQTVKREEIIAGCRTVEHINFRMEKISLIRDGEPGSIPNRTRYFSISTASAI